MRSRRVFVLSLCLLSCITSLHSLQAAILSATFNDLAIADFAGQGGGSGFTGNWAGSANPKVQASDLTSSLYNKPQSAPAQRIMGNNSTDSGGQGSIRQMFRSAATAPVGEVWFSFLAQVSTDGRSGLSLNAPSTASPFANRGPTFLELQGNGSNVDLLYSFAPTATPVTLTNVGTLNSTILVVGQMVLGPGGANDSIKVWLNPDLNANPNISAYTPTINIAATANFADSITRVGVITYRTLSATSGEGLFDNLYISDGGGNAAQAFLDVTGVAVPEPASLACAGLGLLAFASYRWRKPKSV